MLKYRLTALALKGFSSCAPARRAYRVLGNALGARQRRTGQVPFYYFQRVTRNVELCRRHSLLQPGDQLVELGTGWVHWEAITLRLFFDFTAVLYDVWDCRQLGALKIYMARLADRLNDPEYLPDCDKDRARRLIAAIQGVSSFEELYKLLGFRYELDPNGFLETLPQGRFRLAISAGVMEHIPAETAPRFVTNIARCLQPGGMARHSIDTTDHLYLYDRTASPKQYLTYSDKQWRMWYQNQVQYINRIQRSEWLRLFDQAGLKVVEEGGAYCDLSRLPLHPAYAHLSAKDRDCTTLDLVAIKEDRHA